MFGHACPSRAFSAVELQSLRAVRSSLREAGEKTDPAVGSAPPTADARPTPHLSTISANAYVWGYNFVLPGPAMSVLRDGGSFTELLGAVPAEVEAFVPVVEAYLATELDAVTVRDQGAGVILTATWTAPGALVAVTAAWTYLSSWLGNSLVLSVEGASTQSKTRLNAWPYKTSDNDDQFWTYVNGLYIYNLKSNKVVEIADSDPDDDARVQINDFTGALNQRWAVCGDGLIWSLMNGNVLDVSGGSVSPGTPVVSYHPKYPATLSPPTNQGWWTPNPFATFSCDNLVTVIKNNTFDTMTVQGIPQSTTRLVYGDSVQIIPPGAVAVYESNYDNTITGDNAMYFAAYSDVAAGISVSFDAHQHQCAYESADLWVDNVTGANNYYLNSPSSGWYEGSYHNSLPGTIVSSLEWRQNG